MAKKHFFNIVPRDEGFLKDMSNAVPLRVIMDDGVKTTPDINIKVNDLSKGYSSFYNTSGDGVEFKITIIIKETDKVKNTPLITWLDNHIRKMTPFYISTDALDLKKFLKKSFIIIDNGSRKQTTPNETEWELEFKSYNPVKVFKYKNNNKGVLEALNKAKKKQYGTPNSKLRKCDYKILVYSEKKKIVPCVKYMQQILYKKKFLKKKYVNGWFGKHTKAAVKAFQKDYNRKHTKSKTTPGVVKKGKTKNKVYATANKKTKGTTVVKIYGLNKILPTNGKVDKSTWKALCKA